MSTGGRAAVRRTPGWSSAAHWLKAVLILMLGDPGLGSATILVGTSIGLSLGRKAGAWGPDGRAVSRRSALSCPRSRLASPAAQQRPGAARSLGAKVDAAAVLPGEGAPRPGAAVPLTACFTAVALGRTAAVTVGSPAEAWKCFAGTASPVAWSASGSALATAARYSSLEATVAAWLASPRTSVRAVIASTAFAIAALAASSAT